MIIDPSPLAGPTIKRGKSKQDYQTPPDFMKAVTTRFGPVAFDLAAATYNTQSKLFYSKEQDALIQQWFKLDGWLWLNPPFDNIEPWASKCAAESALGAKILFLTPASVGSNWFCNWVYPNAHVLALNGRIHFDPKNPKWGYPKDCILSVFSGGMTGFKPWRWK